MGQFARTIRATEILVSLNQQILQKPAFPRVGRVRVAAGYRTSSDLTRCQSERVAMTNVSYRQTGPWNQAARAREVAASVPKRDANCDAAVEWEFSEAMRSPRFPAAWFVLPGAVMGCLLLALLY